MANTILCVALTALIIFNHVVDGKKGKKIKLPKSDDEDSTPQPSVVTYSTFGFNDVGSYDGFVPSSPDYASYLSNVNQESSTRLYAPAFPTALESTGFDNNYDNRPLDEQSFKSGDDGEPQSSMIQYPQNSMNFFNTPTFDSSDVQTKNAAPEEIYGRNADETNSPVYGAKITSRHKTKPFSHFNNNTDFSVYESDSSNPSENKYNSFHETETIHENKPMLYGESSNNFQNLYNYAPTYPSIHVENPVITDSTNSPSPLNFPKVIDYTKFKQYYPTEMENKYLTDSIKPISVQHNSVKNVQNENTNTNNYDNQGGKFVITSPTFQNTFAYKNNEDDTQKEEKKFNSYNNQDFSYTHNYVRPLSKNTKHKDKYKGKPLVSTSNGGNEFKNWMNPTKGYEYSTNYSNTRFKYNYDKKPFNSNTDEVVPASSNIIDFSDVDYDVKKIPNINPYLDEEYRNIQTLKNTEKFKQDDFIEQYKNLYSTLPTTTSHWGNAFKSNEYSTFKYHPKKPHYNDDFSDDVVHIPKRPQTNKYIFGKHFESKPNDIPLFTKQRPYKGNKIPNSWINEHYNTRYKSEEDLLGLRTHDTSHPSYLPTYKPYSDVLSDNDVYKKLVEKWKQSYWKAKLKDSYNDYESYETETKPIHVPVPKPYPIEVPHPVVVPVPQPYPVRVPIPKPVAIPVVKELTVPIEKPVPYPVVKKVPYPVEKPVPVPVEKQVSVPVMKPYPVMIPHIRPVFHHTKPHDDLDGYAEIEEETDYSHRPNKKIPFTKRPKNARDRLRRPSRTAYQYQDRNRRRWPTVKPSGFTRDQRYVRKPSYVDHQPSIYNYHEESSDYDQNSDVSDYYACKRRGNC